MPSQSHPTQLPAFLWGPWGPQALEETNTSYLNSCWFLNGSGPDSAQSGPHTTALGRLWVDPTQRAPLLPWNSTQELLAESVCFVVWPGRALGLQVLAG